jgi:hypothetical protein
MLKDQLENYLEIFLLLSLDNCISEAIKVESTFKHNERIHFPVTFFIFFNESTF